MDSLNEVLLDKLEHVINNLSEVGQLSHWAEEQYQFWCKQGYDKFLRNRLMVDILQRLRDINDPLLEDWGFQESNSSNYLSEIKDIVEYLKGKKKFIEVTSIKENLFGILDKQVLLHPVITDLLNNRCLSNKYVEVLEDILTSKPVNTRSDFILNETIVAMLNINESLKFSIKEIVSICELGKSNKVTLAQEKKILKELLEVIEGKRAYRLTVCVVKQSVCYTNVIPL